MVECSPATRAARVRFPADANDFVAESYFKEVNSMIVLYRGNTSSCDYHYLFISFCFSTEGHLAPLLLM